MASLNNSDTIQNQNKHKGNEQASDYLEISQAVINLAEHQTKNKTIGSLNAEWIFHNIRHYSFF